MEVIDERASLLFRFTQQQTAFAELLHRTLRVQVEVADRFNRVIQELHAKRQRVVRRKNIHDPAAHRVLATAGNLCRVLVASGVEARDQLLPVQPRRALERDRGFRKRRGRWDLVVHAAVADHDDLPAARLRGFLQYFQTLRGDVRIGQRRLDRRRLHFREKERIGKPVEQFVVEKFLRPHILAHDPHALPDVPCDERRKKRPGGFGDMLEDHFVAAFTNPLQLRGNDRRGRDSIQEIDWFIHARQVCSIPPRIPHAARRRANYVASGDPQDSKPA